MLANIVMVALPALVPSMAAAGVERWTTRTPRRAVGILLLWLNSSGDRLLHRHALAVALIGFIAILVFQATVSGFRRGTEWVRWPPTRRMSG